MSPNENHPKLREFILAVMDERHQLYQKQFEFQDKVLQVALNTQEKHDERANGLIEKLSDQYRFFIENSISKDEYDKRHLDLVKKIDELRDFRSNIGGRETLARGIGILIGIAVGLLTMWIHLRN